MARKDKNFVTVVTSHTGSLMSVGKGLDRFATFPMAKTRAKTVRKRFGKTVKSVKVKRVSGVEKFIRTILGE